jgi:putative ABC transport system substrate-binding protein
MRSAVPLRAATRRRFLAGASAATVVGPRLAKGQQQAPLLAFFGGTGGAFATGGGFDRLTGRLRELGLAEHVDFTTKRFSVSQNDIERVAREIVQLNPAVIITSTDQTSVGAIQATSAIPIVFAVFGDPAGVGVAIDVARPSRNFTGVLGFSGDGVPGVVGKLFEVALEVAPRIGTLGFLVNIATRSSADAKIREAEVAAGATGRNLVVAEVEPNGDIERAFRALRQGGAEAVAISYSGSEGRIVEQAELARLPVIHWRLTYVESGGLMSYGTDTRDHYPLAAEQAAKILRGAKVADVPVVINDRFRLGINLGAAARIGYSFPVSILARADVVIE